MRCQREEVSLCRCCIRIFADGSLESWMSRWSIVSHREHWKVFTDTWMPHHTDYEELRNAAIAGCHLCSHACSSWKTQTPLTTSVRIPNPHGSSSYQITLRPYQKKKTIERDHIQYLSNLRLHIRLDATKDSEVRFDIDTLDDNEQVLSLSTACLINVSTRSSAFMCLARTWLEKCLKGHERCNQNRNPAWVPTRLLHVATGSDTVHLVETNPQVQIPAYATLSHCWGLLPIDVLTPSNFVQFRDTGRCIATLPPTFRDCLEVCRALSIRYVWINSLCILQGPSETSRADWEQESRQMENVYANSILNIGSGWAQDSGGGCFTSKGDPENPSVRIAWSPLRKPSTTLNDFDAKGHNRGAVMEWTFEKLPGSGGAARLAPVLMPHTIESMQRKRTVAVSPHDNWLMALMSLDKQHLFTRAWVVQEHVLSPRMLSFGSNQFWWQCCQEPLLNEVYPYSEAFHVDVGCFLRPGVLDEDTDKLRELWGILVTEYNQKAVSKPELDKLRAFEGIANRVARRLDTTHVGGQLWDELPSAMCWIPESGKGARRASCYQAPSWSWASFDGPVIIRGRIRSRASHVLAVVVEAPLWPCINNSRSRQSLTCIGRPVNIEQIAEGAGANVNCKVAALEVLLEFSLDDPTSSINKSVQNVIYLPIEEFWRGEGIGLLLVSNLDGSYSRIGVTPLHWMRKLPQPETLRELYSRAKPKMLVLT